MAHTQTINPLDIIHKYYADNEPLERLLVHHSRQVADRALRIAQAHPEMGLDLRFIAQAAMLHDIGVFLTDAPAIYCHGTEPYLMHGYLGAQIMRREGLEDVARVCERHTGTGLTAENIRKRNLPLPEGDYRPETEEEQLICYADKFYSKSHPLRVRTIEETARKLEEYGPEGVRTFMLWAKKFEL